MTIKTNQQYNSIEKPNLNKGNLNRDTMFLKNRL